MPVSNKADAIAVQSCSIESILIGRQPRMPSLSKVAISAFITLFNVKAQALGAAGLPGIISIVPDKLGYYIAGMAISFVVAFGLTLVLGAREQIKSANTAAA